MDPVLQETLASWKESLLQKIIGLDSTINELFFHLEFSLVHHVIKGMALLGAPGIGKTFLAKHLSEYPLIDCQLLSCGNLLSENNEESLGMMFYRLLYPEGKTGTNPRLIILDDLDLFITSSSPKALGWITHWLSEPYLLKPGHVPTMIIGITNNFTSIPDSWKVSGRLSGRVEMVENSHKRRASIIKDILVNFILVPATELQEFAENIAAMAPSLNPGDLKGLSYKVLAHQEFSKIVSCEEAGTQVWLLNKLETLFDSALKSFIPAGMKAGLNQMGRPKQRSSVGLSDVYGLENIISELQRSLITPLQQRSSGMEHPLPVPRGILLHGPPGVGKTLLCQALGEVLDGNMVFVESTSLRSSFVGASEKAVADMFEQARQNAPCILCLDQLDALLPPRATSASQEGSAERIVTSFLTELDGLFAHEGGPVVVLLGVTNRPTHIDPAVLRPGRLDIHLQIPLPNISSREAILRGKLGQGLVADQLYMMASLTEGFSGADLENICQEAALSTLRSNLEALKVPFEAYISAINAYKKPLVRNHIL